MAYLFRLLNCGRPLWNDSAQSDLSFLSQKTFEAIFLRFPAKFRELIASMGRYITGNPKFSPSVFKNLVFRYL